MTNEAKIKAVGNFKFAWKASDAADNSIIAYGYANYGGGTKDMLKRLKITYRKQQYYTFLKIGRSYNKIGRCDTLELAKEQLQNEWMCLNTFE